MCICSNCSDVQPVVLPKPFHDLTKIHAGGPTSVKRYFNCGDNTDLIDSNTRHRCPRCSNVLSSRITCRLSSGSACISLLRIWISFKPALYLEAYQHRPSTLELCNTHMVSWARTILIATSLATSPISALITRARTTLENMPFPNAE